MKSFLLTAVAATQLAAAAPQMVQYVTVTASPSPAAQATGYQWNQGTRTDFPIHASCNATERALLSKGLADARAMAQQAKDHILLRGREDAHYQKYFGNASTAEAVGWYDRVINADKTGNWFRCDDPDDKCSQSGWGGYYRGENATMETNICPLSFLARRPLEGMCGYGYDVANGALNVYWASDLIHRMLHLPNIVEGVVDHYADDYVNVTALARTRPEETTRNSETLQLFALEVYAFDVAYPGEGCAGVLRTSSASTVAASATSSVSASASASMSATASSVSACQTQANGMVMCQSAAAAVTPSATSSGAASGTSSAASECHTHSDGYVHC
ncbi:Multifunctional tryptophan biosynthesis protein [Sphaceloma murrayae]|uniref:Multifunctional tryptophan biosynthesis protein n=1 Tax=Sphaceloma murrayae TaxID=2082308 RepID=A0A2K1QNJ8_9PEZI|nr:Multifunctional tryptophan biosynthesis protein [Sphaceloma murrayae]